MTARQSDEKLEYLRAWRAYKGLTQVQLAKAAGIAVGTVRRVEGGESANILTVAKLAKALGVSARQLREEDPAGRA
jgi:transcriptional regulator with XRE-family HTH domain